MLLLLRHPQLGAAQAHGLHKHLHPPKYKLYIRILCMYLYTLLIFFTGFHKHLYAPSRYIYSYTYYKCIYKICLSIVQLCTWSTLHKHLRQENF